MNPMCFHPAPHPPMLVGQALTESCLKCSGIPKAESDVTTSLKGWASEIPFPEVGLNLAGKWLVEIYCGLMSRPRRMEDVILLLPPPFQCLLCIWPGKPKAKSFCSMQLIFSGDGDLCLMAL